MANKLGLRLKMLFFKSNYPGTLLLYRAKIRYQSPATKRLMKAHKAPFIVTSNHVGYYDPILLWTVFIRKSIRFLATDEILRNWFCSFFFKNNGVITISRQNVNLRAYEEIKRSLQAGFWIGIYPEGHINRTFSLLPFQLGAAQIALANNIDLLPLYIVPRRKLFFQSQIVYVGDYFSPTGDKYQVTQQLAQATGALAQRYRQDLIKKVLTKKSLIFILPVNKEIKEEEVTTTFYQKYQPGTAVYLQSKSAWYYLQKILGLFHLELTSEMVTFTESGKPQIADLEFNISHDQEVVSIIISSSPCAIDVQEVKDSVASTKEWTRKEAAWKLDGAEDYRSRSKVMKHGPHRYVLSYLARRKARLYRCLPSRFFS